MRPKVALGVGIVLVLWLVTVGLVAGGLAETGPRIGLPPVATDPAATGVAPLTSPPCTAAEHRSEALERLLGLMPRSREHRVDLALAALVLVVEPRPSDRCGWTDDLVSETEQAVCDVLADTADPELAAALDDAGVPCPVGEAVLR